MNCDTSSLKAELKQELTSILAVMQQSLLALDQAEGCSRNEKEDRGT
ncbi:hypothetical protein ACWKW1_14060 [Brevibacillus parabrevis]